MKTTDSDSEIKEASAAAAVKGQMESTPRSIINTHDQLRAAVEAGVIAKRQAIAVSYDPRPEGRMGMAQCDKTSVWSPYFDTDPKAAWYDYKQKTFVGNRETSVPKALAWATENFRITEWAGNRMRCKIPAVVQKRFPIPAPSVPKGNDSSNASSFPKSAVATPTKGTN